MALTPDVLKQLGAVPAPDDNVLAMLGAVPAQGNVPAPGPAAPPPDVGTLEALLRGGVQGATFGFGDELAGGLQALSDVAFNRDKHLGDLASLYAQHRDESRAAMDAASDQHPYASLIGNLVGGVVPAIASGGASELASGASMAEKMAQAAKLGAGAGALMGLGNSKADLTQGDIGGLAKDTGLGAISGGVVGGATAPLLQVAAPIVGAGLDKVGQVGDWVGQNTGIVGEGLRSLGHGLDGTQLFGNAGREQVADQTIGLLNNLDPKIQKVLTQTVDKKGVALKAGQSVDITSWYQKGMSALDTLESQTKSDKVLADIQTARDRINNWVLGRVSKDAGSAFVDGIVPQEVENRTGGFMDQATGKVTPTAEQAENLKTDLGALGSAGDESLDSGRVRNIVNSLITGGNEHTLASTNELVNGASGLKPMINAATPGLADLNNTISGLTGGKGTVDAENSFLSAIMNRESGGNSMTLAKKKIDEFLAALPEDLRNEYAPEIARLADANQLRRRLASDGISHSLFGPLPSIYIGSMNAAGLVANAIGKATPQAIQGLAGRIVAVHGADGAPLANALNEAATRDTVGRNAMMFAIQQNPAYRKMLHSVAGTDEQK